mmetsp:Transcript_103180/g.177869  ORF Transcript_103180/g.177869 Transcript_103180/m.177869 type:complete len:441 (+) Transcript_103180:933-2255(+)
MLIRHTHGHHLYRVVRARVHSSWGGHRGWHEVAVAQHAHVVAVPVVKFFFPIVLLLCRQPLGSVIAQAGKGGGTVHADEQASKSRPGADEANNEVSHPFLVLLPECLVDEAPAHSTQIATGTNQTGHDTRVPLVNERDETEGGSLGSLNEAREQDQLQNGQPEDTDEREENQHAAGAKNGDQNDPDTTAQGESGGCLVGRPTTNGTGDEVHQPEERCDQTSDELFQTEHVLKVARHAVVDVQLHSEAARVVNDQDPHHVVAANLFNTLAQGAGAAANQLAVVPVALGAIVREKEHENGNDDPDGSGNLQGYTPSRVIIQTHGLEHLVQTRGCSLGHTTTEVAPTASHGVSLTDDLSSEHLSAPELAGNESGAHEANQQTYDVQPSGILDGGAASQRCSGEQKQESHRSSCTESITGRTDEDTSEDGSRHSKDIRVVPLRL